MSSSIKVSLLLAFCVGVIEGLDVNSSPSSTSVIATQTVNLTWFTTPMDISVEGERVTEWKRSVLMG